MVTSLITVAAAVVVAVIVGCDGTTNTTTKTNTTPLTVPLALAGGGGGGVRSGGNGRLLDIKLRHQFLHTRCTTWLSSSRDRSNGRRRDAPPPSITLLQLTLQVCISNETMCWCLVICARSSSDSCSQASATTISIHVPPTAPLLPNLPMTASPAAPVSEVPWILTRPSLARKAV